MVLQFSVFAIRTTFHVHDGLNVARCNFHHNHHTYPCANLLHLFEQRAFGQVLHVHVNGRNDVGTIDGRRIHDIEELVEHLSTMDNTVRTAQNGIVRQFQSKARRVFRTIHVAHGTSCQRTVWTLAGVVLFGVEAALIFRHVKNGQRTHLGIGVIVHAFIPQQPMSTLLIASFF